MDFCQAMDKLKEGGKVTRNAWKGSVYFKVVDNEVRTYQPSLRPYVYNDEIMISEGWLIIGNEKEYRFCEIILFLQQGAHAKLKKWDETYIYLDRQTKQLVVHSMDHMPFIPDFESFTAVDWMEVA